jgi:8-oxo-dGTP diphosphatase
VFDRIARAQKDRCKKAIAMKIALGADCVVRSESGEVLLVKREDFRVWTIPGGATEWPEAPAQTAVRETLEEPGVEVAVDELVGVYSFARADNLMFVYTGHPLGGQPRLTPEAVDVHYFAPDLLPDRMFFFTHQRLFDALSSERGLYRYQPTPLWARPLLPLMLRGRRLRNRLEGRLELPAARRNMIVEGVLNGGSSGAGATVTVEPQPGQPVWETLREHAEQVTGTQVQITRVLDVCSKGEAVTVRFELHALA